MSTATSTSNEEAKIQALIDRWAKALRAKDAEGVISCHGPGFVQFSLAPPLQYAGATALDKKGLEEWFSSFQGSLGYEINDLKITVDNTVGYSHSLNRLSGNKKSGEKAEMWFRETMCFRKISGEWKISHEHESVPFYMDGSVRAAIDLKP